MLKNRKVLMALSLVIAIALWIFVVGTMNPVTKNYYADVPIKFLHEEQLEARGLAVAECNIEAISVTLTGQKSQLADIQPADISATIDLAQLELGDNSCKIRVRAPEKSQVYDQSDTRVIVTVEEIAYEEKNIEVVFSDDKHADEEPSVIDKEIDKVMVSGAKSLVANVDHVNALVDGSTLSEAKQSFPASLVAVDKSNNPVDNVSTKVKSIEIIAALLNTKTVPLKVSIEGIESGGIERQVSYPEEITIKGHKEALDNVKEITAEPIYVGNVKESTKIKLVPILPNGISIAKDNEALEVLVSIDKIETKSFTIDSSTINVDTEKTVHIEKKTIKITVVGKEDIVKALTEDSFKLSANIDENDAGKVKAKIKCHVDAQLNSVQINPERIQITIEE